MSLAGRRLWPGVARDYGPAGRTRWPYAVASLEQEIGELQDSIDELEAEIERHKKEYSNHGGITLEEWTTLHSQLKGEEEKRERINWQRKASATDSLPFIIISDLVAQVLPQLQAESKHQTYRALKISLEGEAFSKVLTEAVRSIGSAQVEADTQQLFTKISDYLLEKNGKHSNRCSAFLVMKKVKFNR